jgi:deoxyribonuclease V
LLIVDANGILHPRRIGMASQLGIVLDIPTIGITKNLFIGKPSSDGKIEIDKEIRGEELRTKEYANPIYLSPGHRISLRTASDLVKKMIIAPHKLPKPLHLAHRFARKAVRSENGENSENNKQESKEIEG